MAERAKHKIGQEVEFTFAGSVMKGRIVLKENINNKVRYKIANESGRIYPVQQGKVLGKVK